MDTNWIILFCIVFGIGLLFDMINIGIYYANLKGAHVSGVPFTGCLFFCAALLIFPETRPFFLFGIFFDVTVYSIPLLIADNIRAKKYGNVFKIVVLAENSERPDEPWDYPDTDNSEKANEKEMTEDPDNKPGKLQAEHGLSLYIEHGMRKFLLDAGQSGLFADNAEKLGIDLSKVDAAILSHAHYDHADGFEKFFSINKEAKLYMRKEVTENCYSKKEEGMKYIGPRKGMLEKYKDRIVMVDGGFYPVFSWADVLIPHSTKELDRIGWNAKLFKEADGNMIPDDFDHEQTLIMHTRKGIVVFSSCSHAGPVNILREVRQYECNDEKEIYAYIGGFHLMHASDEEIYAFADELKTAGVKRIITGHCTGERAAEILKAEFGDAVEIMHVGMVIDT